MDFTIPADIQHTLARLDDFIEREIKPLEQENIQYFDHRREYARTDWERGGLPRPEWEGVLAEMQRLPWRLLLPQADPIPLRRLRPRRLSPTKRTGR